jgi:molybdenum cofactor cytidylyltransferase
MISSVKLGVAKARSSCDALLLSLGDQPLVRPETMRALIDNWQSTPVHPRAVLPRHDGKRGHPVLIDRSGFEEIRSLADNQTLKTYISRYPKATMEVDVPDPAVLFDVDTPEDYARAEALLTTSGAEDRSRRITPCLPTESPSESGTV